MKNNKNEKKEESSHKQEPRRTQELNKMIMVNGNQKGELIFNIIITKKLFIEFCLLISFKIKVLYKFKINYIINFSSKHLFILQ